MALLCERCGSTFDKPTYPSVPVLCWPCLNFISRINQQVHSNLRRARRCGEPATLTVQEWIETLEHFNYRCAYCFRDNGLEEYGYLPVYMDHFIPLGMGIGTVRWNCTPACKSCNIVKRHLHPSVITLIPKEALERVQTYLTSLQNAEEIRPKTP